MLLRPLARPLGKTPRPRPFHEEADAKMARRVVPPYAIPVVYFRAWWQSQSSPHLKIVQRIQWVAMTGLNYNPLILRHVRADRRNEGTPKTKSVATLGTA